jgi:serine protease AprX
MLIFLYSILTPVVLALPSSSGIEFNTVSANYTYSEKINNKLPKNDISFNILKNRIRPNKVIDDYLHEVLSEVDSSEEIEIIIQFINNPNKSDLQMLADYGIEIIHQYSTIPAVLAKANKLAIEYIAESENVFWIEFNEPIEFHMNKSLSVINATKTWNTIIKDENGNELPSIDGSGVTVVVLDTGIDAGHPDLDYETKTVINLKSDFGFGPWVEMENSDTSYGHGTHCAGTVAGNGEASAGARSGVAPGAKLIGLSIGDFGINLANALGGYEWIYENTKLYTGDPDDLNIRVISNSWGPSASKFDPTDAISQMIEKCTVDHNVVSVFAAGNSGENNHDGHTVETNPYGSTPMSIMVAATERNGMGMAYFSSRGEDGLNETWPDVAAPGVRIWSAAARRTYISIMKNLDDWQDLDPYYFAISGTSMATPHVAGATALLFQACPSLKLSYQHDDYSGLDDESYKDLGGSWWDSRTTLVHEAELILEASANYITPTSDNGLPDNNTIGWTGGESDFAQGYGLINVEHAVAIALTLNELRTRDFNSDGDPDFPNATVYQAIKHYQYILEHRKLTSSSNKLISHWNGEWTRFSNGTTQPNLAASTDQSRYIFIPESASQLVLHLHYEPIQTSEGLVSIAGIRITIDYDNDGSPDWSGSAFPREQPDEIPLSGEFSSNLGNLWNFNIEGVGFGLPNSPPGNFIGESYYEITMEYSVDLELIFDAPVGKYINENFSHFNTNDPKIGNLKLGGKITTDSDEGLSLYCAIFDLKNVLPMEKKPQKEREHEIQTPWYIWLLLAITLAILAALFYRKYRKNKEEEME